MVAPFLVVNHNFSIDFTYSKYYYTTQMKNSKEKSYVNFIWYKKNE